MAQDFEKQKAELMKEVRSILDEVESLYDTAVEEGSESVDSIKSKVKTQLAKVQSKLSDFEEGKLAQIKDNVIEKAQKTDELVRNQPYYALGIAALAGVVVGALLKRR